MNPLHPSSSTTASTTDFIYPNPRGTADLGRPFTANEHQHFHRRPYDSTLSSSTLRLALYDPNPASQANPESNLTNMDRFSVGSAMPFHHEPRTSHRFHELQSISFERAGGNRGTISDSQRESLAMPFLHRAGPERRQPNDNQRYQWINHAVTSSDRNPEPWQRPVVLPSDKSASGSQQIMRHSPPDLPRPRPPRETMSIQTNTNSAQTIIVRSQPTPASVLTHGGQELDNMPAQSDANKSTNPKKKHGCWMCHKSFDRPRYEL
jgi:hypothetical protein